MLTFHDGARHPKQQPIPSTREKRADHVMDTRAANQHHALPATAVVLVRLALWRATMEDHGQTVFLGLLLFDVCVVTIPLRRIAVSFARRVALAMP